jgi:hypothetical protein
MREPETNIPIDCEMKDIVVSPNAEYNARNILHQTQVLQVSGASAGLSGTGGIGTFAPNPLPTLNIYKSNIWNKVLVDSGVSQTNADIYTYCGDLKSAFVWREAWPFNLEQLNPMSPEMKGREIAIGWAGSWYATPQGPRIKPTLIFR